METRNRSSYPDSPHPGHGHPDDWITKPYSIVFTGVVLFILIFGIAAFQGYRQLETTKRNALTADKTTANLLADLILEHNKATIGILQSYAHRPLFIAAVKNKDLAGVHGHLSDLKKNAEIDLTFVTDTRGILWANFPVFPEAIGKDLSSRDWYKGISTHWKPYISMVFKLIVGDKPLAVAVCVPVFDERGRPIGILGNSQRLGFIDNAIERVPLSPYTTVNVIDRAGQILYSNKFPYQENITDYRFFPILEPAVKEKKQQIEIIDPQKGQEKSYLTVVSLGDIGWSVVIERSLKDIYRTELRRFIETGAISFLLFLLIIVFLVYLRKATLFRKTEELLQAETKLRQGEEKYRAIIENMEDGYHEVDIKGNFTFFNESARKIMGYEREELLGMNNRQYADEENTRKVYQVYNRIYRTGEPVKNFEWQIIRKDGARRDIEVSISLIRDMKGNKTGFRGIVRDTTDRKQAEETLHRSEENFRHSLDDSPMGVRIVTVEGETIYANRAILDIYGFDSLEELRTTPIKNRYTPQSYAEFNIRREKRKRGDYDPSEYEISIVRKNGEIRHIQVFRKKILWNDEEQFQVIYQDITERKRAEEALRKSQEQLREAHRLALMGVWNWVAETDTVLWTEELYRIAGLDPMLPAPTYAEHPNIYAPESWDLLKEAVERAMKTGDPYQLELKLIRPDGTTRWVKAFGGSTYDSHGRIQGLFGTVQDITERKQAEEEKHHLEERSRKVVEDIFRFIPEGVLVFSRKMELLRQNQAFRDLVTGYAGRLGFAEDELENLIIDKVKAGLQDNNIKEIKIARKHEVGKQT